MYFKYSVSYLFDTISEKKYSRYQIMYKYTSFMFFLSNFGFDWTIFIFELTTHQEKIS